MSEYMFGAIKTKTFTNAEIETIETVAKEHGADFIVYTPAECSCGYGCRPFTCTRSTYYWFTGPNRGFPFDRNLEREVLAAVEAAGVVLS